MIPALAQVNVSNTLTDAQSSTGPIIIPKNASECSFTASTGATFGSGTITLYDTADNGTTWKTVSGFPDLGNPLTAVNTLTSANTVTFPVASHDHFKALLTGSTGASIPYTYQCTMGVARAGGGAGGVGSTPSPIPSGQVMGNISSGPATPVPIGVSALLDATLGSTQGDILYRGASAWNVLAPGSAGQYLQSGGSGANPSWMSFEQTIKNFCTANSISGCHYWCLCEASGTVAADAIGTLNGTYNDSVSDLAAFGPQTPMGMPDGSVGADMWGDGTTGYVTISGLATPSPMEEIEGVVVRDCNSLTPTSETDLISGFSSGAPFAGLAFATFGNTLNGQWGNGSALQSAPNYANGTYASTCHSMLLIQTASFVGGQENLAWFTNGIPNATAVNASPAPASSIINVNSGYRQGTIKEPGKGVAYCCLFFIPYNYTQSNNAPILQIQAGSGL